jgi:hypothetical protein
VLGKPDDERIVATFLGFCFVFARRGYQFMSILVFRPSGGLFSFTCPKETHTYKSKEKGTPDRFLIQSMNAF